MRREDMYRPNVPMSGGDYISTSSTFGLSSPSMTTSSIYYIMSVAKLAGAAAVGTLTGEQLSTLKSTIEGQITNDELAIAANTISVAKITRDITISGGFQDQFSTADYYYQSTLNAYNRISSLISTDNGNRIADLSSLSSYTRMSTQYTSTLVSYEAEYTRIISTLSSEMSTINFYEQIYQTNLLNINSNAINYSTAVLNLSSVKSVLQEDLSSLSIPNQNPAIIASLSTQYANNLINYNNISSNIQSYILSSAVYNSKVQSAMEYLKSVVDISTFQMISTNSYASTIAYFSSLGSASESTIQTITSRISSLNSEISVLTTSKETMQRALTDQMATIGANSFEFYNDLSGALNSECDEYSYGIQEYNAQIGYIAASLGIAVNANSIQISGLNFQILDPSTSTADKTRYQSTTQACSNDNSQMISIINAINVLDVKFTQILNFMAIEKDKKNQFIKARQNIFNTYELPAINYNQSQLDSIQTAYINAFGVLNNIISAINIQISNRTTMLAAINTIVDPLRTGINYYFQTYLNIAADQLPDMLTRMLDSKGNPLGGIVMLTESYNPESNSVYALIPPINFTPGSTTLIQTKQVVVQPTPPSMRGPVMSETFSATRISTTST